MLGKLQSVQENAKRTIRRASRLPQKRFVPVRITWWLAGPSPRLLTRERLRGQSLRKSLPHSPRIDANSSLLFCLVPLRNEPSFVHGDLLSILKRSGNYARRRCDSERAACRDRLPPD